MCTLPTDLDIAVEKFLKGEFAKLYPHIGYVGEENGGDRGAGRFFLVDPIDGTSAFVRGLPFCTTMVALIENGEVTFSAIYNFVTDTMYSAEKGNGAFKDGTSIRVSARPLHHAYLAWETHLHQPEYAKVIMALEKKCCLFKTISSGYEYALVAEGRIEGRIAFNPYGRDYDFAPCALLVQEAGGIVANIGKTKYDYRNVNFITANPTVFKTLTEGKDAFFPIV